MLGVIFSVLGTLEVGKNGPHLFESQVELIG